MAGLQPFDSIIMAETQAVGLGWHSPGPWPSETTRPPESSTPFFPPPPHSRLSASIRGSSWNIIRSTPSRSSGERFDRGFEAWDVRDIQNLGRLVDPLHEPGERGARPQFDKPGEPLRQQMAHGILPAHG